jgi:U3 small nucleolar RNA-associated protein 20
LADLPLIPLSHPALHPALLRFTTSTFTAAEMPLWVGPAYNFLQSLWASKDRSVLKLTLSLNLSLAELGWGGWKIVALPLLLKNTMSQDVLESDPRRVINFLASLKRLKKLSTGDTDFVWRERVERFVTRRLQNWTLSGDAESAVELVDMLALSGLLSASVTPVIVGIVDRVLASPPEDAEQEYMTTPANSASVLGACMQALLKRDPLEWTQAVDVARWAGICVRHWGWSYEVLAGLYALSQASTR